MGQPSILTYRLLHWSNWLNDELEVKRIMVPDPTTRPPERPSVRLHHRPIVRPTVRDCQVRKLNVAAKRLVGIGTLYIWARGQLSLIFAGRPLVATTVLLLRPVAATAVLSPLLRVEWSGDSVVAEADSSCCSPPRSSRWRWRRRRHSARIQAQSVACLCCSVATQYVSI